MYKSRKSRIARPKRTFAQRVREGLAILSLLAGTILLLSLLSYHPDDPSWSITGAGQPHNMLGAMGATLSDICLKFFGYHSYVLVFLCLWFAFAMLLHRNFRLSLISLTGYVAFALLSAGLWHLWWGLIPGGYSSGGLWGQWLAFKLSAKTGSIGASLLLVVGILLAAVWTTQFSISHLLYRFWVRMEPWVRVRSLRMYERWLDWRDGVARWRWERQQKQQGWEQGEGQWAVADGMPSELPQLELESSWLKREHHWAGSSARRREEHLPQLTPPELQAVEEPPENDCQIHDVEVDKLPKEASFWASELADEHQVHSMDIPKADGSTKNIRLHKEAPAPSLPGLASAILRKNERTFEAQQQEQAAEQVWGDSLAIHAWEQELTIPEVSTEELQNNLPIAPIEPTNEEDTAEDENTTVEQRRDTFLAETAGPVPEVLAFSKPATAALEPAPSHVEVTMSQVEEEQILVPEEPLPALDAAGGQAQQTSVAPEPVAEPTSEKKRKKKRKRKAKKEASGTADLSSPVVEIQAVPSSETPDFPSIQPEAARNEVVDQPQASQPVVAQKQPEPPKQSAVASTSSVEEQPQRSMPKIKMRNDHKSISSAAPAQSTPAKSQVPVEKQAPAPQQAQQQVSNVGSSSVPKVSTPPKELDSEDLPMLSQDSLEIVVERKEEIAPPAPKRTVAPVVQKQAPQVPQQAPQQVSQAPQQAQES